MIVIAFITYERLDYSKRSMDSLVETLAESGHEATIVAFDNGSNDGTQSWLREIAKDGVIDSALLSHKNRYPGAAANTAWEYGLNMHRKDARFLMRSDNDMLYKPGWLDEAYRAFEAMEKLGQLGLMSQSQCWPGEPNRILPREENGYTINVHWGSIGGTHIMRRELWDVGVRYDESPWMPGVSYNGRTVPAPQEDVKLSLDVQARGYFFGNMIPDLVFEMSYGNTDDYFDYYCASFAERGHPKPDRTKDGKVIEQGESGSLMNLGLSR